MSFDRKAVWGRKFGGASGQLAMRAKGRQRQPGQMNPLERDFERHLQMLLATDQIAWYGFDVIKLRLADNTFLSVDFFVMQTSGELHAIDVKGGLIEEDARVKMRVVASAFPIPLFYAQRKKKAEGGGWVLMEV